MLIDTESKLNQFDYQKNISWYNIPLAEQYELDSYKKKENLKNTWANLYYINVLTINVISFKRFA